MLQFDRNAEYLAIPGLRERIRVRNNLIQGETGWSRVATSEEEAMFQAVVTPAAPPAGVGARTCSIHLVKNCPMCENTIQPGMGYQATPTPKEGAPDLEGGIGFALELLDSLVKETVSGDGEEQQTYLDAVAVIRAALANSPAGSQLDLEAPARALYDSIYPGDDPENPEYTKLLIRHDVRKAACALKAALSATPPAGPAVDLEADEAMRRALIWMGRAITTIECDCEAEGHVCGKPELQRDTELLGRVRKRLRSPGGSAHG